jgi:hypothetical protein
VILRPLEEGLQYRYLGNKLFVDVWVDWQRQQYRYSNYQEEIAGGLSSSYRLSGDGQRMAGFGAVPVYGHARRRAD